VNVITGNTVVTRLDRASRDTSDPLSLNSTPYSTSNDRNTLRNTSMFSDHQSQWYQASTITRHLWRIQTFDIEL